MDDFKCFLTQVEVSESLTNIEIIGEMEAFQDGLNLLLSNDVIDEELWAPFEDFLKETRCW